MRVIAQSIEQFEALKPIAAKLRVANSELHVTRSELRLALALTDSTLTLTKLELSNEQQLHHYYQVKSANRGWTIAGFIGVLILGFGYSHR